MALKGAAELDIFTHIGDGASTAVEIAGRTGAAERGVRILCDFLTIHGFLMKDGDRYGLTPESALFLNKRSPAYTGTIGKFLVNEHSINAFRDIAATVRHGGALPGVGHMDPENPIWVEFAHSMVPIVIMAAQAIAPMVTEPGRPAKVLDIAAGHGMFGVSVARHNPAAEIVAVDWKNVLEVALENATRAGVRDRYRTLPGSAFDVEFGSGYDVVLLTNFLHHFEPAANVKLLRKIHAAMKPGGVLATLEFVPNDDRVTPPVAAAFSMIMLANTERGDAYTFAELGAMLREAGFADSTLHDLQASPQRVILSRR